MEMKSIPNASFLSETLRKEDDARKAETNSVSAHEEHSRGMAEFAASVKSVKSAEPAAAFGAVSSLDAPDKSISPVRAAHPAYDRYVPKGSQEQESFGYYQRVTDKDGKPHIQFDRPTDKAHDNQKNDTKIDASQDESNIAQRGMEFPENAESSKNGQNEDAVEEKPETDSNQLNSNHNKLQELKKQKKQLKQKIKATKNTDKLGELKRKLAQVERAIKAASH